MNWKTVDGSVREPENEAGDQMIKYLISVYLGKTLNYHSASEAGCINWQGYAGAAALQY